MDLLIVTNLFPNSQEPTRGMFVFQETLALKKNHNILVIAPLPWAPKLRWSSTWGMLNKIPQKEEIAGITIYHPRYFVIPKIGRRFYGLFFYYGIKYLFEKIYKSKKINAVISHYAYPDGYATQKLSEKFNLPHIIKVRGSDVNVFTKNFKRRQLTKKGLMEADTVVTVSKALKKKVEELGVPGNKVITIRNGIDEKKFNRINKTEARKKLGWNDQPVILFVGNLVPIKGIATLLQAYLIILSKSEIKPRLVFVGDGELKDEITEFIEKNNLHQMIQLEGKKIHEEIPKFLSACDVLCLPSLNEGCPNIIVEGVTIGTKIVASAVGGIPELLESNINAVLVPPLDTGQLAAAIIKQLGTSSKQVNFNIRTWENVANETIKLFDNFIIKV